MRGAWIEMHTERSHVDGIWSLPVRGAWIEIVSNHQSHINIIRRSPCGERGLK